MHSVDILDNIDSITMTVNEAIEVLNNIYNEVNADLEDLINRSFPNGDNSVVEEWAAIIEQNTTSLKYRVRNKNTKHLGGVSQPYNTSKKKPYNTSYNSAKGFKIVGDIHTHPYSLSEGKPAVASHSGGDITYLRNYLISEYTMLVVAKERIFALMIIDLAKAKKWYNSINDDKIEEKYAKEKAASEKRGNGFNQACSDAVRAVIGSASVNGIAFFRTNNGNKAPFICTNK